MVNIKEQIVLYCQIGNSDKEYRVQLVETDDWYVVNYQNGRRGSALASGTKTKAPISYEAAKKVYDKLVAEKIKGKDGKGYTPSTEESSGYTRPANAGVKTDFVPQLLNVLTHDEAMHLIQDDNWGMQEKFDGDRRGAGVINGCAVGMNRRGMAVALPTGVADELLDIAGDSDLVIDAEIIGDHLYQFDFLKYEGRDIGGMRWIDRMNLAAQVFSKCQFIHPIPVARTTEEKRALWQKVSDAKGEGVVFKRMGSASCPGRPASGGDWMKFPYRTRASFVVLSQNQKRSVKLGLIDNNNHSDVAVAAGAPMIFVGNVTIPANARIPEVGEVVEVDYLYAYRKGSVYQPVFLGARTDIDASACTTSQLKYRPEDAQDEDGQITEE